MSKNKSERYIRIAQALEIGLKSGKDWLSVLRWQAENDPDQDLKNYLSHLCHQIKIDGAEEVLKKEKRNDKSLEGMIFLELLRQANRGAPQLSQLFRNYAMMISDLRKAKQRQNSLLAVPKMQAALALILGFSFSILLPVSFPEMFPSFLSLQRWDLFCAGIAFLLAGVALVFWMCYRPARYHRPALQLSSFFYLVALFLESGTDFISAWNRALDAIQMSPARDALLRLPKGKPDSIYQFFEKWQNELEHPWPFIINGLSWTYRSGLDLSSFMKETSHRELERLLFCWEDEVRKLGVTSLIPLGVIVFPASIFLLLGPQFILFFMTGGFN